MTSATPAKEAAKAASTVSSDVANALPTALPMKKPGNKKTALALASMALVFFAGVIVKRWLFPGP